MSEDQTRNLLSTLPAVESVLKQLEKLDECKDTPREVLAEIVREKLAEFRKAILEKGQGLGGEGEEEIFNQIKSSIKKFQFSKLQPVINATGVLIHTNMGRSPLGSDQAKALYDIATQYNNLELDLESGARGTRAAYVEKLLQILCESEKATMVNNCASALVLVLRCFASSEEKNEVIVSRGELVEIGGGFRIPEIMEASGAKLVEVGATNKTNIEDYRAAITDKTALLMKIHQSNFYMEGFTEAPEVEEISELAKSRGIPFFEDLGSGAMMNTDHLAPIEHEPTPIEQLKKGADIVCFSGDKLLGGPQAGIIAGQSELIARLKKEPFFRAVRCDKLILAVLQETILAYFKRKTETKDVPNVPTIQMMNLSNDLLRERTENFRSQLSSCINKKIDCEIVEGMAKVGGGTMPKSEIPSTKLVIKHPNFKAKKIATLLRSANPPVMGQIEKEHFQLDLRTVFPEQEKSLISSIDQIFDK